MIKNDLQNPECPGENIMEQSCSNPAGNSESFGLSNISESGTISIGFEIMIWNVKLA